MPLSRMDPPPRSFAADAHGCIMVGILVGSTECKVVARLSAPDLKASPPPIVTKGDPPRDPIVA
jgi:hypothetical protein